MHYFCVLGMESMYGREGPNGFSGCSAPAILASFCTTFNKKCGRAEDLGNATCPKSVVGGKQVHACCKICLHQQIMFLCLLNISKIMTVTTPRRIWPRSTSVDITQLKTAVSVCLYVNPLFVSGEFHKINKTVTKCHVIVATLNLCGYYPT